MDQLQQHLRTLVQAARGARIPAKLFARICYRQYVLEILEANGFNVCKAAKEMCLHRNTLTRQIDELDINMRALRERRTLKKSVASERPYSIQSNFAR